MKIELLAKRDGRKVAFSVDKIHTAISKAVKEVNLEVSNEIINTLTKKIVRTLESRLPSTTGRPVSVTVEVVQDTVEEVLIEEGYVDVAKVYILYRAKRTDIRNMKSVTMQEFEKFTFGKADDVEAKRENANIDSDSAMGTMLKYGSTVAKEYNLLHLISEDVAKAHRDGTIHIHDLDFYALTETCCQIGLDKLFKGGFGTGHGILREPTSIGTYSALTAIAIQSNQNDQHGGQSIPALDYYLAPGVVASFKKNICIILEILGYESLLEDKNLLKNIFVKSEICGSLMSKEALDNLMDNLIEQLPDCKPEVILDVLKRAYKKTEEDTYQAMEGLIANLNTMHSRAGAQVPFSSINYGTDTSVEGRMIIKSLLQTTWEGLGGGETPIFPIQIFKLKEGINYNPGDQNYDLFKLACKVSAKRLFPNFSNLDVPFNSQYLKQDSTGKLDKHTEVAYMGCRTRVMGNVWDPTRETVDGRGNLSFTSINLPRIAIILKEKFKSKNVSNETLINQYLLELQKIMELVHTQLLERFEYQCKRHPKNYPFLMQQGVWIDSECKELEDDITDILKHGTLSVGFIGLAETLKMLFDVHQGESESAQKYGLEIIGFMRNATDKWSASERMNYSVVATPAEGLSGRFVAIDRKLFGIIPGVTDREYYTNSFHVPVYTNIDAFKKIEIEAPYHALCNGGHISYVEVDGDLLDNLEAFENLVRVMHDKGVGYGAINHPIDRDPVCGYTGIIKDICPKCKRRETEGTPKFERIRRITGYLVGTLDTFNTAKHKEVDDRVKHVNL